MSNTDPRLISAFHPYSVFYSSPPPCPHTPTSISKVEAMIQPYSPDADSELPLSSCALMTPSVENLSQSRPGSPMTPLRNLLTSSPSGFWNLAESSMSPIFHDKWCQSCHSKSTRKTTHYCESQSPKLASLEQYQNSSQSGESERIYNAPSSPCSLSSLSSISTSLSASSSPIKCGSSASSLDKHARSDQSALPMSRNQRSCNRAATTRPMILRVSRYRPQHRPVISPAAEMSVESVYAPKNSSPVSRSNSTDQAPDSQQSRKRSSPNCSEMSKLHDSCKRRRVNDRNTVDSSSTPAFPNRTFPLRIPINEEFPLFYRRFPVSSVPYAIDADVSLKKYAPASTYNPPRDAFDLYTPRFTQGRGASKVGLCPCCFEDRGRGGEGRKLWLAMKFSAYNYHMQYAHGISAVTGRPFSPPTAFQVVPRSHIGKHEKSQIMQGKCHKCKKWVNVEGIKDVPTKVKELVWWKHAAACHQGSTIPGECDVYLEDEVYARLASSPLPNDSA